MIWPVIEGVSSRNRLGDGVGEIVGGEAQHLLVEDIDDVSLPAVGQRPGESLREEDRGPQIDVEMRLPCRAVERGKRVGLKARGVVDEAGRCAEGCGAIRDQLGKRIKSVEIGGKGGGLPAIPFDLGDKTVSLGRRPAIMHADAPTVGGEIERDDPAESSARAGHERGPVVFCFRHAVASEDWSQGSREQATLGERHRANKLRPFAGGSRGLLRASPEFSKE